MAQNIVRYKQRSHRTKFLKVTQGSKNLVYSVYIFQWCKQPCDRKCEWQNEQMGEQWFWTVSSAGITYHIFLYLISNACISFAKKRLNETIKNSRSWNSCQAVIESFQAVNKETTSCLPAANHLFFSCQDVSNGVKTQHLEQLISSFVRYSSYNTRGRKSSEGWSNAFMVHYGSRWWVVGVWLGLSWWHIACCHITLDAHNISLHSS